jgi:hypothetical protein
MFNLNAYFGFRINPVNDYINNFAARITILEEDLEGYKWD